MYVNPESKRLAHMWIMQEKILIHVDKCGKSAEM